MRATLTPARRSLRSRARTASPPPPLRGGRDRGRRLLAPARMDTPGPTRRATCSSVLPAPRPSACTRPRLSLAPLMPPWRSCVGGVAAEFVDVACAGCYARGRLRRGAGRSEPGVGLAGDPRVPAAHSSVSPIRFVQAGMVFTILGSGRLPCAQTPGSTSRTTARSRHRQGRPEPHHVPARSARRVTCFVMLNFPCTHPRVPRSER